MNKNKITLYNIASTIILQGLTFLSGPIFSNALGTHNYGISSVYLTWVQIASTVFTLQAAGTIANARVSFPIEEQENYQSSVFSLSTFSYLIFSAITLLILIPISHYREINILMVISGLAHGWGMYCVSSMNAKFTYEFKADKNFLLSVSTSFLTIGLSIALIKTFPPETNYWGRILGQSTVYLTIGIILYLYILHRGKTVYSKEYWAFTLPIAVPTIFHLLAYIILNQSDRVMLQKMLSSSEAGIYSLAYTFSAVLSAIYQALNNSWVPFYYEYTRQNEIEKMKKHAKNYLELFTIISMGFILLSREVFRLYAGRSFWKGTDYVPLFALGYYFVFLYSFPVNYEFYHKKTKTIAIGTTGAAFCNIILNYFLILSYGSIGAVIATVVSYGLQFIFHSFCAKKIKDSIYPFALKEFIPGLLSVSLVCCFYFLTKDRFIIRWVIAFALGIYILGKMFKRKEIF